jgi:hypothetical protein
LRNGVLEPSQHITQRLVFRSTGRRLPGYSLSVLSGQGVP